MCVSIAHALCPEEAHELADQFRDQLPEVKRVSITELGSALGVHGGPGTLLAATMPYHPVPEGD